MIFKQRKFILISISAFIAIVVILMGLQRAAPKKPATLPQGDYTYTIEFAEHKIQRLMEKNHLPSVAVVLVDEQDVIWQETFGMANLEEKSPAESKTVYKLWSVSKAFTAIETMRLLEEGMIDLDTPISSYLTDFSVQSRFPDSGPITIRSILTHRSGLPRNECHWIDFDQNVLADLAASLEDCYQTYPVGYQYKYSNIGFDVLGYLIQEMRGELFPEHILENLLMPIGMKNSAFIRAQVPSHLEIASGYEYYKGEFYPYEQSDITSFPSGNLYSTIEDMGQFLRFIFRGGKVNGEQIISPRMLGMMFAEQTSRSRDPQPMGLGWKAVQVLGTERLVWHDGGPSEGVGSLVAFFPERKLGVILLANGTSFDGNVSVSLALDILKIMLETKYGVSAQQEKTQRSTEIDSTKMEEYTGKYIAFGEVFEIFQKGEKLKGKIKGLTFSLIPLKGNTFQPKHWLSDLGLTEILQVPIDLSQLQIEFMGGDEINNDVMVISMRGIFYEICPKYPRIGEIPLFWDELSGDYELFARLPSETYGFDVLGNTSIQVVDGVLQMSGMVGPIMPISSTEIIILSGPFAGETMLYEPGTGNIYHQMIMFKHQ